MSAATMKKSALFICLGNICRSPIAAAVFRQAVRDRGEQDKWIVESAALGSWHVGNPADYRAQEVLKSHNVDHKHSARQIKKEDFNKFDYIFGMDDENMKALKKMAPENCKAQVLLLISFDPQGDKTIRDPYYDSDSRGFELCYQQCVRACNGFLDGLRQ
ncbi:low molecular weight phosphotyrosine protein phosphatase-like [Macrosteles quadrilineatus]|uniref:low molecular weight phosphotyrosine protein phosphatase-like n=1 Tax=Macrosteles quadrilineatus TaxID=74068 RepID=UPI0023E0C61A|nr:low molecular weight phosphotyrosine protein phosphatase-like [Macrosteles quadrilineatus]XP_054273496.1 low molecular weight phosphotyrosine protein phosphatase-like [Macrosteles quadrilineatus]